MSTIAVTLVVISAVIHAGWNLLSKSNHPQPVFFFVSSLAGAVLLLPFPLLYFDFVLGDIPVRVWLLLVATGFFMALYYIGLAGAYRSGDMSVAYPLARSVPVLLVAAVTFILDQGDRISASCLAGLALIFVGCFLIPQRRFGDIHLKNYFTPTCGLALVAAVGTTGYSVLDDKALRLLRSTPPPDVPDIPMALLYACLQAAITCIWLALYILVTHGWRSGIRSAMRMKIRHAIFAGLAIHLAYGIVLISLAYVDNVSYVVGLRQLSIPLGALLGIMVLHEEPCVPKLVGTAIMFGGLLLVAFG